MERIPAQRRCHYWSQTMHRKATQPEYALLPQNEQGFWTGPWMRPNHRPNSRRLKKVKKEAHHEQKWALLLGGRRKETEGGETEEELRSEAHDWVRRGGTCSKEAGAALVLSATMQGEK